MSKHMAPIEYSNGKWVKIADAAPALGMTTTALIQLLYRLSSNDLIIHMQRKQTGEIGWYLAYAVEGRDFIELAKYRKSLGINAAIESHKLGAVA